MLVTARAPASSRQSGFTLLEVLITIIILAFGLLALANLQTKMHQTEMESYQRAQAVLLVQDMANRIYNNRGAGGANVVNYVTANPLGTDNTTPCDVVTDATQKSDCVTRYNNHEGAPSACAVVTNIVQRDQCEWAGSLMGAAETRNGANIGAMIGARGCVEQIQAPNPADGFCVPGIYRITVAWQGMGITSTPKLACAKDKYGDDAQRRVISNVLTIGVPRCV